MTSGIVGSRTPHGVPWTYSNHACRCDDCRAAWNNYMQDYMHRTGRARPRVDYLAERYPELPPHGTETRYTSSRTRCRCDDCKRASREARARRRARVS